jgi:hypothetical protein
MISKEAHRASSRLQQNTIDHQLYELERTCWGCHVARIEYVVAGESELCSIGIIFLRPQFSDNTGVTDVTAFVEWGVFVPGDREGVPSLCLLFLCSFVTFANALAHASKLI